MPTNFRLDGEYLEGAVDPIRITNPHFNSFLAAFSGLHRDLSSDPALAGKIDFRDRQPLDRYLLFAIRAESCFRYALDANSAPGQHDKLETYLQRLAETTGLDPEATDCLNSQHLKLANLRSTPKDFIAKIEQIGHAKSEGFLSQMPIGQAMLCCLAARNYFAHHDYHDSKLLNDRESQFLMGGILLAVLTLLRQPQPRPMDSSE